MNPLQSLPVVYALLLVDIAANWHVSPEELLADFGLTREMLLNPQGRVSLETFNSLIIKASHLTQEAGLAIYFGQKRPSSSIFSRKFEEDEADSVAIGITHLLTMRTKHKENPTLF